MSNWIGAEAGTKLVNALLKALQDKNCTPQVGRSQKSINKIQSIAWNSRLLLFDKKPKFINKSVDVILLCVPTGEKGSGQILQLPEFYLACGELKGGIDPAGADEHWKTGSTSIVRIRDRFSEKSPALFFVGAAIANAMAREIFDELQQGKLNYAANLTKPEQLDDLASWLVNL